MVFVGKKTLKAVRKYLKRRPGLQSHSPLFATDENERLSYTTIRKMIQRRAMEAGIEEPGLHDFRRAFGLQCQRNGLDLLTISRLLGHANTTVTERYICQDHEDLARGHDLASPVDRMM